MTLGAYPTATLIGTQMMPTSESAPESFFFLIARLRQAGGVVSWGAVN
jgi:hypothetical protein